MGMYQGIEIAHLFVQKGIDDGKPLTHMKLQKMVYFAHGLHLAAYEGKPLIIDSIEAWQFGPVIPSIYDCYSIFSDQLIADTDLLETIRFYDQEVVSLDPEAQEIVDLTWETLASISAIQLSNWTHNPGSAWSRVYEPGISHINIPNELIIKDFEQFNSATESASN